MKKILNLTILVFLLNCVTAFGQEGKTLSSDEFAETFNAAVNEEFSNTIVLTIPDESGQFSLQRMDQLQSQSPLLSDPTTLIAELEKVLSEKKTFKILTLKVGANVRYQYLYDHFVRPIENYVNQHFQTDDQDIRYWLQEPI